MKIVNTQAMRAMDEEAIHTYGIHGILLMEHAALSICSYIKENISQDKYITILCGPGNNGGDGFALARLLIQEAYSHVTIVCSVPYEEMSDDEALFASIAKNYKIPIVQSEDMKVIAALLESQDCIVDALFGIGLNRNIEGFYKSLIQCVNKLSAHIISIDIPSGIHGNRGVIMNCAIQATTTITFTCMKTGHVIYPGSAYCGKIIVASIGIPNTIVQPQNTIQVLDTEVVTSFLPKRRAHSHKGSYGKVLMIGGSSAMHGAITLCANAALHSGLGTLTLMIPESIRSIIAMKLNECMLLPTPDKTGVFTNASIAILKEQIANYDVLVLGNGMGRGEITKELVKLVLESDKPCIIDADALYEIGSYKGLLKKRTAQTILTPHPKEMSYISGKKVSEIIENPIAFVRAFMCEYPNLVLVYKDQHTIIAHKQDMYMNMIGNDALAKGGSGDVLCGILSGLFAQGKDGIASACSAVYVHGMAADILVKNSTAYTILPSDLIAVLPKVYKELKNG